MESTAVMIGPTFSSFVKACETACESACCGLDAFDFGPINIAAWLTGGSGGGADMRRESLSRLESELHTLERKYGVDGVVRPGLASADLNQILTGVQVAALVAEIRLNAGVALHMIELSEARRAVRTSAT